MVTMREHLQDFTSAELETATPLLGWWYVIGLCFPAMMVQGACGMGYGIRWLAPLGLMIFVDLVILLRAVFGVVLSHGGRTWLLYCSLYVIIIPLAFLAVRWVHAPDQGLKW
jgi:hypothetical protein